MTATSTQARPTAVVHQRSAVITAGVLGLVLCWALLMPPGSGPDEPGHLVRSGAVVRGEFGDSGTFELPDRYRVPEPGCYAFDPTTPVSCAADVPAAGETVALPSRSGEYPPWGHLTFGLPSGLPGLRPIWWARLGGAIVSALLVGWALREACGTRRSLAAATLVGITPMAWSTFGTVNPSSIAIAGSVALWVGLVVGDGNRHRVGWLTAVGWAALALPRRDGLIWTCIALAVALAATDRSVATWWRSLHRGAQVTVATSTLMAIVWAVTSESRASRLAALAPLLVVAGEGVRWLMAAPIERSRRFGVGAAGAVVAAVGTIVLLRNRPGGWDTDLAVAIVEQTGNNLIEAIGVLGWLDTRVPFLAVVIWLMLIGGLFAASAIAGRRTIATASILVAVIVLTSWVFELYQGNTSGLYWQGRYSIPLLTGVPILLASRPTDLPAVEQRIAGAATFGSLIVLNIAAWAAARRFGAGTTGTFLPWRWDTIHQPVHPLALLAVHAALSLGLAVVVVGGPTVSTRRAPASR
ncbi:MAG: DUF2142 domain-containing protein [Ilumatobacter sp.]|uniref:DUF2142 domain-containing protein n=1 Tax=Ilumatobacter sp. TaxID=1967498 RepID=UPI002636458C|nr:DUF2142 domain-containing protein [Ilumatobacter sp.]MDJ0768340.1 DUF2142 domain-containing protein [Ilumatobacter sp.]